MPNSSLSCQKIDDSVTSIKFEFSNGWLKRWSSFSTDSKGRQIEKRRKKNEEWRTRNAGLNDIFFFGFDDIHNIIKQTIPQPHWMGCDKRRLQNSHKDSNQIEHSHLCVLRQHNVIHILEISVKLTRCFHWIVAVPYSLCASWHSPRKHQADNSNET